MLFDLTFILSRHSVFRYMIVLFTGRDNLDYEGVSEETFLETLPEDTNIKELVMERCSGHWIFFNNRCATKDEREAQTQRLLAMIEELSEEHTDNKCYTSEDLQSRVNKLFEESKVENLDEFREKVMTDESFVDKVYKWIKIILRRK